MKKFLLIREQDGGCDYTIGCGTAIARVDAGSMDELVAELRIQALADADGHGLLDTREGELTRAYLVRVVEEYDLPLDAWREEKRREESAAARRAEEAKAERAEAKERAEYERLKAKFR